MTDYIPTTHKFVAVVNKKVPIGNAMNAVAHATAGLIAQYSDTAPLRFNDYTDKDGSKHPSISDNPFIILQADNSNKLRGFRQALLDVGIPFTDFTSAMTVGTYAEQHDRMHNTPEAELDYWAVVTYGENETMRELTKKFSLLRS